MDVAVDEYHPLKHHCREITPHASIPAKNNRLFHENSERNDFHGRRKVRNNSRRPRNQRDVSAFVPAADLSCVHSSNPALELLGFVTCHPPPPPTADVAEARETTGA